QRDGSRLTLSELSNRRLIAVAGIAQPQQFFAMLRERGLVLAQSIAVPDHFSFLGWSCPVQQGDTLLCTEKDAVKLWPIYPDALAVPLTLTLDPGFLAALDAKLAAALAQKQSC
ncbi:MAG: tetraacyldisaccharide 4'-kinase, partial [Betaproteobacteria bacterium]